ncbi:uncharacterized protein [Montipora foliosa]|uniref:uncharacterized protein n=1 Tax=Montipora foliosa TaxID=591990 RepID=UPI0035F1541D
MLIEDDIHFIHAPQHPSSSTTSTAWHMCTGLMDIQPSVSAITRPAECQKLHRVVPVVSKTGTIKQCRGGVSIEAILGHFKNHVNQFFELTYMATLPPEYRTIKMRDAKKSCENLRVYSDEARGELQLLNTTWLIDEFQQNLKSVHDYEASLNHLLMEAPELCEYLGHYASIITGDFPTWKYNKKIVAKWNPTTDPESPIPSLIPWQGPFHVSLNAEESTVLLFRPLFEKL